jgi:apolipoprotein N-acyltransferase
LFARPGARALAFAPAWCAAEYVRSHFFIGFPWLLAGDTQIDGVLGHSRASVASTASGW